MTAYVRTEYNSGKFVSTLGHIALLVSVSNDPKVPCNNIYESQTDKIYITLNKYFFIKILKKKKNVKVRERHIEILFQIC
jgi:hypothetical protein